MEGLVILGVFIIISMLLGWLVRHDRDPDGKTSGLFAMREPADAPGDGRPTGLSP